MRALGFPPVWSSALDRSASPNRSAVRFSAPLLELDPESIYLRFQCGRLLSPICSLSLSSYRTLLPSDQRLLLPFSRFLPLSLSLSLPSATAASQLLFTFFVLFLVAPYYVSPYCHTDKHSIRIRPWLPTNEEQKRHIPLCLSQSVLVVFCWSIVQLFFHMLMFITPRIRYHICFFFHFYFLLGL